MHIALMCVLRQSAKAHHYIFQALRVQGEAASQHHHPLGVENPLEPLVCTLYCPVPVDSYIDGWVPLGLGKSGSIRVREQGNTASSACVACVALMPPTVTA